MSLLRRIIDSLPQEIILIDAKTRKIVLANRQFERMQGIEQGMAEGKSCHQFYHSDGPDRGCTLSKTIATGKPFTRELLDSRNKRQVAITTVLLEGGRDFILHITADITVRKRHEDEHRKLNRQLLRLGETSARLQRSLSLERSASIMIKAFQSLGYDRVRIYIMRQGSLHGLKSSHLPDEAFSKVVLAVSTDYPKAYEAIRKRKPVIITDPRTKYTKLLEKQDVKESAALPLISSEKTIGLISLDNKFSRKPIHPRELHLLMTFANQAASAIENFMLLEENRRKVEVLQALYDISSSFAATLDLQKAMSIMAARAVRLLKADSCALYLLNESKDSLVPHAYFCSRGKPAHLVPIDPDIAQEQMGLARNRDDSIQFPLLIENTPIGLFMARSRKRRWTEEDRSFMRSVCSHAAILIENSRLYDRIRDDKEQLSALIDISQSINSTLDEERLLELVLERLKEYTKAEKAAIYIVDDKGLRLALGEWYQEASGHEASAPLVCAGSLKPVIQGSSPSEACIPIIVGTKAKGVLRLGRSSDAFKKFRKSLEILTSHIQAALENSRMYAEIRSFNLKLRVEVDKATRELKAVNQELRKMDQMKSDFVSNVSHELRTPLTSISGYTRLLSAGKLGPLNRQQKESLKIVSDETERLTRLINEVLDLSKLESARGKPDFVPVKLHRIAKEAVATMKTQAKEKRVLLRLRAKACTVHGSPDLLKQVFINLIGNAIKFTEPSGSISVAVWADADFAHASVSDTGIGIPKDAIPKLFSKFYQVDASMTRQRGGTGLGLVIVKHIITQHGGKIEVRSEQGKGSEFSFRIPLSGK